MWFQLTDADHPEITLRWEDGHLSGEGPAMEWFTERMAGDPVVFVVPDSPQPPGYDDWRQFLATAFDMPQVDWDTDASDDGFDAIEEYVTPPEGAVN